MDIIIVVAPTGAGKNYLLKNIEILGFRNAVSHTTREPRNGESDGRDYYFIDKESFKLKEEMGQFIEVINFGGPDYGLTANEIKCIRDGGFKPYIIVEPNGLEQILNWFDQIITIENKDEYRIQIVYLDIPRSVRYKNILKEMKYNKFEVNPNESDEVNKRNRITFNKLISGTARNRINRNGDNIKENMELYLMSENFNRIFNDLKNNIIVVHIDNLKDTNCFIGFLHFCFETNKISRGMFGVHDYHLKKNALGFDKKLIFIWQNQFWDGELKFYLPCNIQIVSQFFDDFYKVPLKKFDMLEIPLENIPINIIQETKVKKEKKRWYQIQVVNKKIRIRVFEENENTQFNFKCPIVSLIMEDGQRVNNPEWFIDISKLNIPRYDFSGKYKDTASVVTDNPKLIETFIGIMKNYIYEDINSKIQELKDERKTYRKMDTDISYLNSFIK